MKLSRLSLTALIATVIASGALHAQVLSVGASGPKKVTISDRVGKNQIEWNSDAPLEKIKGTAEGITGSLTLDPKNPASLKGTVSAQVGTMKTGNGTRDEHLHSPMWLDAARYPAISFTIVSVGDVKSSGSKFTARATGDFTMHGVTKRISVPVTVQYIDATAKTRERAPGDFVMITADFDVALKDFNVSGREGVVGSKVGERIQIGAKFFGSTGL